MVMDSPAQIVEDSPVLIDRPGPEFTVTVAVSFAVRPLASVTVTMYDVVVVGHTEKVPAPLPTFGDQE